MLHMKILWAVRSLYITEGIGVVIGHPSVDFNSRSQPSSTTTALSADALNASFLSAFSQPGSCALLKDRLPTGGLALARFCLLAHLKC